MAIRSKQRLDAQKAVEVLLYVTGAVSNMYNALKVLYFADKMHLAKYGRLIYGDSYVAMKHGPVPSEAYDIVKAVRGDGLCVAVRPEDDIAVEENAVTPLRPPNAHVISDSERECLDLAIAEYGHLPFGVLRNRSHDRAWRQADENDIMSLESIAASLPNAAALLAHLRDE